MVYGGHFVPISCTAYIWLPIRETKNKTKTFLPPWCYIWIILKYLSKSVEIRAQQFKLCSTISNMCASFGFLCSIFVSQNFLSQQSNLKRAVKRSHQRARKRRHLTLAANSAWSYRWIFSKLWAPLVQEVSTEKRGPPVSHTVPIRVYHFVLGPYAGSAKTPRALFQFPRASFPSRHRFPPLLTSSPRH